MTVQDEARDLLRRQRAAEDDLAAVRREIADAVADRCRRIDRETAEALARRLRDARERKRVAEIALQAINDEAACG
jgi:hypothetical protein